MKLSQFMAERIFGKKAIALFLKNLKLNNNSRLLTLIVIVCFGITNPLNAQNIFSGERVQVVGSYNGYVTNPYGSDYRTSAYRRLSVVSGTPTDGRGQWATTINIQNSGGDATPINMSGGGSNGFLFISGPSSNRFQNKWVFSGIGQAAVGEINTISAFNSGNDMGLNMNTTGYYTMIFNDCGYTQTNAKFYVGFTENSPVSVSHTANSFVSGAVVVDIATSDAPSTEEKVYVRYRVGTNDFSTGTSVVEATGSNTNWSANITGLNCLETVYYYVFTSTRTLTQINAGNEFDRSLAILRYDDNAGSNYSFTLVPNAITTVSLPSNPICANTTTTLTANGVSGTNANVNWYTGPGATGTNLGTGATLPNVGPGLYYANVTGGCTNPAEASVTVYAFPGNSESTVSICNSYSWNGTTYKASGDYYFNTTGAGGCDSVATLHLTILSVTSNYTSVNVTGCNGTATGSITINPTYGVSPFTYRIGTVGSYVSSNTFNGLKAGSYRVSIKDVNGCAGISDQIIITQPDAISFTTSKTDALCYAKSTGSITITSSTGSAPFTYRLGTIGSYVTNNVFSNLRAASYKVYVKDANGCSNFGTVIIGQPTAVTMTNTKTDLSCYGANNGSIILDGAGGTVPYAYRLGTSGVFTSNNSYYNLKPGSYRAYIQDANNCLGASTSISILQSLDPCNPDGRNIQKETDPQVTGFNVQLSPNPSSNEFVLKIKSENYAPVNVKVIDINGKNVFATKIFPEQNLRFGNQLAPGIYLIELRNGVEFKVLKAIKIK